MYTLYFMLTGYEASWNAALDEQASEYAFQPNNRYLGEQGLTERGTECFNRGDLAEVKAVRPRRPLYFNYFHP